MLNEFFKKRKHGKRWKDLGINVTITLKDGATYTQYKSGEIDRTKAPTSRYSGYNGLPTKEPPPAPPNRTINEGCICIRHRWRLHESTETYNYLQCIKCGKLKTTQLFSGGYSPIKQGWPKP